MFFNNVFLKVLYKMKKNTVEIALIILLVLMMYFQNDFINNFSKSLLGKSLSLFAVWYVVENFGRNAGILAALIMISNLYNAYNPIVDTVEGFFEGQAGRKPPPKKGGEGKPEQGKPEKGKPEQGKPAQGSPPPQQAAASPRPWLSKASKARLMQHLKKKRRRGEGDDDDGESNVSATPQQGEAQGFANRLTYSELDGGLRMRAAENTQNASS